MSDSAINDPALETQVKEYKSFPELQQLLSEITGNDVTEITLHSHLTDELGFDLDEDLSGLLSSINDHFDIELNIKLLMKNLED